MSQHLIQRRALKSAQETSWTHKSGPGLAQARPDPTAAASARLRQMANGGPQVQQLKAYQAMADGHPLHTGPGRLPARLQTRIEAMSGLNLDTVQVHYNSARPAQLGALAFAQGTQIHLAPGQEQHLAHEAWHVVQQAQNRVTPSTLARDDTQAGATAVNTDAALEHEADTMAAKADAMAASPVEAALAPMPVGDSAPAQLKQSHAAKYIAAHSLGIDSSVEAVDEYVADISHPKSLRKGLLAAWNKSQVARYRIDTPEDLVASSTSFSTLDTLAEWHSDDENDWDLDKIKHKLERESVELVRGANTADRPGVSDLSLYDSIRLSRQVVKRDTYEHVPITTDIGGFKFEFSNPGTKDIYATPLEELPAASKPSKSFGKMRRMRRTGTSRDFNWSTLTKNLKGRTYKDPLRHQRQMFRFFLQTGVVTEMDRETAEALAAMACDLMKGSSGGRFYLHRVLRRLESSKHAFDFQELFSGSSPIYEPAARLGRGEVTRMTTAFQIDANKLLNVNNCLINAIALAAGRPLPNLGELIRIRERLQNYGEMLLATPAVVDLIRIVLGIANPIRVIYAGMVPPENFVGLGLRLDIYHVGGNHFTHLPPG